MTMALVRGWRRTTWLLVAWTGLACVGLVTAVSRGGPPEELIQDCVDAGLRGPWRRWFAKLGLAWGGLWLLYQLQIFLWPEPAGPDGPPGYEVFLFFVPRDRSQANFLFDIDSYCEGGIYESVLVAAALGGVLWAAAGALGRRWPERRGVVAAAYVVVYATTLVLLYVLASSIWGPEECSTD